MTASLPVWARAYEGFTFEESATVAGVELKLNGVGVRQVAWLKGYAAGLYVVRPGRDVQAILDAGSPVRVKLGLMLGVGAQEFTKAVRSGIRKNYSKADQAKLADRVEQFDAVMKDIGRVRKGDVVVVDGVPNQGLVIRLNDKIRGQHPIPGDDFVRAFVAIFIGQRPVDERLKAGLLMGGHGGG